jgi:molybdopterin-binding protein
LETIRSVRHGDVIAEVDTDLDHGVLIGSDGSTVVFREVAHFTVNANGDVSVAFDKFTLSC